MAHLKHSRVAKLVDELIKTEDVRFQVLLLRLLDLLVLR